MAILKFRVYFEEDDSVYRDVAVKHTQTFLQLHQVILKAYEFDSKHQATFFRSNDHWQRGREISLPYTGEGAAGDRIGLRCRLGRDQFQRLAVARTHRDVDHAG